MAQSHCSSSSSPSDAETNEDDDGTYLDLYTQIIENIRLRDVATVADLVASATREQINFRNGAKQVTPLHEASRIRSLEIAECLIKKGAKPNAKDWIGWTPLHYAAFKPDSLPIIKYLIEAGADPKSQNRDGLTAAHAASLYGRLDVMEYLINKFNDINEKTKKGETCLFLAIEAGRNEAVKWLLDNGAQPNLKDSTGQTPLHYAASEVGSLTLVEYLVEAGADSKARNNYGRTAAHAASLYGRLDVMEYLIGKFDDIDEKTDKGETCLSLAIIADEYENVQWLLDHEADPKIRNGHGLNALHVASLYGRIEMMEYLIDDFHNVDEKTDKGQTCLSLAAFADLGETVQWLLEYGAVVESDVGETAWETSLHWRKFKSIGAFALKQVMEMKRIGNASGILLKESESIEDLWSHDGKVKDAWCHLDGNIEIFIYALLWKISQKREDFKEVFSNACRLVFSKFQEDSESGDFLGFRDTCLFANLISTADKSDNMNKDEEKPGFLSLVMPYFYSALFSDVEGESRKEMYAEYTKRTYRSSNDPRSHGIHLPETLDEHCNPGLDQDILDKRNEDQVLVWFDKKKREDERKRKEEEEKKKEKEKKKRRKKGEREEKEEDEKENGPKLVMIPRLWLWKVDDCLITALPKDYWPMDEMQRMSPRYIFNDPEDTKTGLGTDTGLPARLRSFPELLVGQILSHFVDSLNSHQVMGLSEPIFGVFGRAISGVSEEVKKYLRDTEIENISIEKEQLYLHDIADVREELSMLKTVLFHQEEVWRDFTYKAWPEYFPTGQNGRLSIPREVLSKATVIGKDVLKKVIGPQDQFPKYKRRIDKLDEDAERVERSIMLLLDLKQKHTSLKETHTASVVSAAVFGFTIVTIIFTPLSFLASLFALPIDHFQQYQMPSHSENGSDMYSTNYVGKWMATGELVSLALTGLAVWVALERIMHVRVTRYFSNWVHHIFSFDNKLFDAKRQKEERASVASEDDDQPRSSFQAIMGAFSGRNEANTQDDDLEKAGG